MKIVNKLISVIISIIIMMLSLSMLNISALSTGNIGANETNIVWSLDDEGNLTISGSGKMRDMNASHSFDGVHNNIKTVTIEEGIVNIGSYIFSMCENMSSISIPVSVTKIGEYSFAEATALRNVFYEGTKAQWENIVISAGNDRLIEADITYKAEPHACIFGEWRTVNEPTCVAKGSKIRECSCGNKKIESIPATGIHTFEWKVVKEATCTGNGTEKQCCTVCSYLGESRTVNKLEHIAGEWQESSKPTCTDNGLKVKKCENCGEVLEQENIAPTGHDFGNWKTTVEENEDNNGEESRTCKKCKHTETRVIDNIHSTDKILLGDADGNGEVMATDARLVLQVVAGIKETKDLNFVNADVNKDNQITAVDARFILQIVAGIE